MRYTLVDVFTGREDAETEVEDPAAVVYLNNAERRKDSPLRWVRSDAAENERRDLLRMFREVIQRRRRQARSNCCFED